MNIIGRVGEDLAKQYLLEKNHKIIKTNIHSRYGEIDILSEKARTLYVIEVKTDNNGSEFALSNATQFKFIKLLRTLYSRNLINNKRYDNILFVVIHVNLTNKVSIREYPLSGM